MRVASDFFANFLYGHNTDNKLLLIVLSYVCEHKNTISLRNSITKLLMILFFLIMPAQVSGG